MKKLLFLTLVLSSCAIKPVCHLDNEVVIITSFNKHTKTVECTNLTHTCFGAFKCYEPVTVCDTVFIHQISFGSVAGGVLPVCLLSKKP